MCYSRDQEATEEASRDPHACSVCWGKCSHRLKFSWDSHRMFSAVLQADICLSNPATGSCTSKELRWQA